MKRRKRRNYLKATALAFWGTLASSATATTYFVDDSIGTSGNGLSWGSPKKTIQEVFQLSPQPGPGDEVLVGQGVYKPSSQTGSIDLKTQVKIKGGYAGYGASDPNDRNPALYITTLTGDLNGNDGSGTFTDNAYQVVYASSGVNPPNTGPIADRANLDGFVITGGRAANENGPGIGGGIYCDAGSKPTIRDCIIQNNSATYGGGVYALDAAGPALLGCTIQNNSAESGGGVYLASNNSAFMVDCRVSSNHATHVTNGIGGGIVVDGGTSTGTALSMINCQVNHNTATAISGGMYAFKTHSVSIINCTFASNSATNGSSVGGGYGEVKHDGTASIIRNCIFWGNSAASAAQIYIGDSASDTTVQYSDVQGGFTGTGNINSNPMFVGSPTNFRLQSSSPCKDAGDTSIVPDDDFDMNSDGTTNIEVPDLDRLLRVRGTAVDQGTFEGHTSACCADINGNGVVNIDDLVLLINGWDHPGLSDIAYAIDACGSDGMTGIDDLATLINDWGNCPGQGSGGETSMPQSLNDCFDLADESGAESFSEKWMAVFLACKDNLCQRQVIDCDE